MSSPVYVSVISGKGGSGKTSVSLSISKMLTMANLKVLLVDLDSATHGASYFFDSAFPGLEEYAIVAYESENVRTDYKLIEPEMNVISISDCMQTVESGTSFAFIPSKTNFEERNWKIDFVTKHADSLIGDICEFSNSSKFDLVIFDCQAGVNAVTAAALTKSKYGVIVTEADSVSTKALRNIQNQFSAILPKQTWGIINKLFLSERSTYGQIASILKGLEFLPPIPFDLEIRDAFAQNTIPLETDYPTAFFAAILRISKELLPEFKAQISTFASNFRGDRYKRFEEEFENIQVRKETLEEEIKNIISTIKEEEYRQDRIKAVIPPAALVALSIGVALFSFLDLDDPYFLRERWGIVIGLIGVLIGYIWMIYLSTIKSRQRKMSDAHEALDRLQHEKKSVDQNLEKYTTLYLTRKEDDLMI